MRARIATANTQAEPQGDGWQHQPDSQGHQSSREQHASLHCHYTSKHTTPLKSFNNGAAWPTCLCIATHTQQQQHAHHVHAPKLVGDECQQHLHGSVQQISKCTRFTIMPPRCCATASLQKVASHIYQPTSQFAITIGVTMRSTTCR